jgi:hypothetical protein
MSDSGEAPAGSKGAGGASDASGWRIEGAYFTGLARMESPIRPVLSFWSAGRTLRVVLKDEAELDHIAGALRQFSTALPDGS